MTDDYLWNPAGTPDPEIERLERSLRAAAYMPVPLRGDTVLRHSTRFRAGKWSAIAAGTVLATGALYAARSTGTPWQVSAAHGTPIVRTANGVVSGGALTRGGVVETDAHSTARVNVGRIGHAELAPGSRLRLVDDGTQVHRLTLERGTMHASVDAPPRYFLVQTASALAVDLGCEYTLTVDERGNGLLTVDEGEVELQSGNVRVAVLAGNAAALYAGRAPGLPYPVNASAALHRAVAAYDADARDVHALDAVLVAADSGSTITLWHLLQRVNPLDRERVYVRLAAIAPAPRTVSRERVLRGESGALQRWRTELEPRWATASTIWQRVRRTLR